MKVRHHNGSYEVEFCRLGSALGSLPPDCLFITDENLAAIYGEHLPKDRLIVVKAGETSKSITIYQQCLERLAELGATRRTAVVGFGGGVVGDLAGFVSATYMRGVPFIQIPTTLLAQVDSSVGGKVGIDLEAGKNLAGAFYPPKAVYVCVEVLQTLDKRQFDNGMAEVWKYGFIADRNLYARLSKNPLSPSSVELEETIERCLEIKAHVVEEDEFEENGLRAILNFGHTVGHAIEHICGYEGILHGEAIAIGMVAEAHLGENLHLTASGTTEAVRESLGSQGLPTEWNRDWDVQTSVQAMQRDKKRTGQGLAFSLLKEIGECKLVTGVSADAVVKVLSSL